MKTVVTDNTFLTFVHLYHKQGVTHKNTLKVNYANLSHGAGKDHLYIFCTFTNMNVNCAVIFFSYIYGKAMLEVQWK
jgi:hypothetical protein